MKFLSYVLLSWWFLSGLCQSNQVVAQTIPMQERTAIEELKQIECPQLPMLIQQYQEKFQKKMGTWSEQYLQAVKYETVFYPFSGPDAVTVLSLFPQANYFVLVADQQPEYEALQVFTQTSKETQDFECQMLARYAYRGFYLTNDLIGKNGPRPRFIKLLIYNLAFAQVQVKDIQTITISAEGRILPNHAGQTPHGVRFELINSAGRAVTLDYVVANLADTGLRNQPHFERAFARKASQVVFIKSASHLLQNTYFSTMQSLLVKNAKWIIQDETGIDIDTLTKDFDLQLFGKFIKPNTLWAKSESANRLAQYYEEQPSTDQLPFRLGYEKAGGSILMIGKKK